VSSEPADEPLEPHEDETSSDSTSTRAGESR
jgi:hypothetical protein